MLGGVLVTLLAEAIAMPAGLITAAVLTRALLPETYGQFVIVASTEQLIEWLLIAILARPVVKFVAEADDWRSVAATSFRVYVGTGLGIAVVVWAFAGPIALGLDNPDLARYFRLFAPQIPIFAAGAASRNILAGRGRYRQQALSSAVGWIGRLVFIVLFVVLGYGVEGAILGSICGTLSGSAMALTLVGGGAWGRAAFPVRRLLTLALPAFLSLLFARLLDQVGILSLQVLSEPDVRDVDVGHYGAAMNALMVTSMIAAAVTPVLLSSLTAARHAGREADVRQISAGAIRFGLALFPFAAIVAGASGELAVFLFGLDYAPAGPLLAALMVSAVARANVVVIGAMLVGLDRAWTAAAIAAPMPIVALAAHIYVIPQFGGLGAAIVTMTVALVATLASVLLACAIVPVSVPVGTAARSATFCAVAFVAAAVWPTPGSLVLVKATVLAGAVLAGFLVTGELSRHELTTLRQTVTARGRPGPPVRNG
jgi:O-antigen/teichoic acid export membrane protein